MESMMVALKYWSYFSMIWKPMAHLTKLYISKYADIQSEMDNVQISILQILLYFAYNIEVQLSQKHMQHHYLLFSSALFDSLFTRYSSCSICFNYFHH